MPINADALAVLAGNLAGAIAPGSIGAGLGAVGAEANQGNILAANAEQRRQRMQELIKQVGGLTGEGVTTTGLNINPDGSLKVTGTAAPRLDATGAEVTAPQPTTSASAIAPQPTAAPATTGGGNQSTSPFFNLLGI